MAEARNENCKKTRKRKGQTKQHKFREVCCWFNLFGPQFPGSFFRFTFVVSFCCKTHQLTCFLSDRRRFRGGYCIKDAKRAKARNERTQ